MPPDAPNPGWEPYLLWTAEDGWASQEVVGESHYRDELLRVLGDDLTDDGASTIRIVELVPEPDNPHDRYAVSVRFANRTLGYLPRGDALRYQRMLCDLLDDGLLPVVRARIVARRVTAWSDDGEMRPDLRIGVYLFLTGPDTALPLNDPPTAGYTLLAQGGSVQVLRTNDHFDVLKRYSTPSGTGMLLVTLASVEVNTARTSKRYIEIRLDDERIGQLSAPMSEKFLPAVDHFAARGLQTAARAMIVSSSVAAKVTVRALKAYELGEHALEGNAITVPRRRRSRQTAAPAPEEMPDTVVSGITVAGNSIVVTEKHSMSVVEVTIDARTQPLTAWQQKEARRLADAGSTSLAAADISASPAGVSAEGIHAYGPLDRAQEFVDAFIGIEDSDFSGVALFERG